MGFFNTGTKDDILITFIISCIACVSVVIFYTIWTVKVIQHLLRSIRLYRVNKRKDFRDKREQDRILYNYETHIVKDAILIILSCSEVSEVFVTIISTVLSALQGPTLFKVNTLQKVNTIRTSGRVIGNIEINTPSMYYLGIIVEVMFPIGAIVFLLLLSFLTEYLSRRYFNHSFRKAIINYLILSFIQLSMIIVLSNLEIYIILFIIAPILVLIDWCILVRNCRKLRNVLKSNVRDLSLHFTNRYLYRRQLREFQIYTLFMPILLAALFFGVLALIVHFYFSFYIITLYASGPKIPIISLLHQIMKNNFDLPIDSVLLSVFHYGALVLLTLHFLLLGLPLYGISVQMFLSACVKRIRGKQQKYRFNYSEFPHLLGNC